jgi:hypothetical protein
MFGEATVEQWLMFENSSKIQQREQLDLARKVLVYVGPSLDAEQVLERIPEAVIRPPAKQSDLISDLLEIEPTHILLIDGEFAQALSVWQKEIIYALQIPGVKAVYGAASMGALRAADLADYGMIGCGRIFRWYDEGVITDESEVSVLYYQRPDGSYVSATVPLVNVRAALDKAIEAGVVEVETAQAIFNYAASIHWSERTMQALKCVDGLESWLERIDQKKADALELICTFEKLVPRAGYVAPKPDALSPYFSAQFERDRLVRVNNTRMALQYLDAYIMLHDVDYHQKLQDANNRTLALLMADLYHVNVSQTEFDSEWSQFCARLNLTTVERHQEWMAKNNINLREFCTLMIQEARIHKLHRALSVRCVFRRNTQRLFDYLRVSDSYAYWGAEAARHEERIRARGVEESLSIDLDANPHQLMMKHLAKTGLSIAGSLENYAQEAGFGSIPELTVALERDALGADEND